MRTAIAAIVTSLTLLACIAAPAGARPDPYLVDVLREQRSASRRPVARPAHLPVHGPVATSRTARSGARPRRRSQARRRRARSSGSTTFGTLPRRCGWPLASRSTSCSSSSATRTSRPRSGSTATRTRRPTRRPRHAPRRGGARQLVPRRVPREPASVPRSPTGASRRRPESNRCTRLCRPLRSHSATSPGASEAIARLVRDVVPRRSPPPARDRPAARPSGHARSGRRGRSGSTDRRPGPGDPRPAACGAVASDPPSRRSATPGRPAP